MQLLKTRHQTYLPWRVELRKLCFFFVSLPCWSSTATQVVPGREKKNAAQHLFPTLLITHGSTSMSTFDSWYRIVSTCIDFSVNSPIFTSSKPNNYKQTAFILGLVWYFPILAQRLFGWLLAVMAYPEVPRLIELEYGEDSGMEFQNKLQLKDFPVFGEIIKNSSHMVTSCV